MTITTELAQRIEKALHDFTNGRASMHVPPLNTDVDIVLADCLSALEAKNSENLSLKGELSRMTIYRDNAVNMRDKANERIAELEARPEQQPVAMKDHQLRELVNQLKEVAITYHGTQQLRERIAHVIRSALVAAPAAQPVTVKLPGGGLGEFERGVFYAAYLVCELHDDPTIAADVLKEANLDGVDVSSLDDCEKEVLLKLNTSEKLSLTAAGITIAEGE